MRELNSRLEIVRYKLFGDPNPPSPADAGKIVENIQNLTDEVGMSLHSAHDQLTSILDRL